MSASGHRSYVVKLSIQQTAPSAHIREQTHGKRPWAQERDEWLMAQVADGKREHLEPPHAQRQQFTLAALVGRQQSAYGIGPVCRGLPLRVGLARHAAADCLARRSSQDPNLPAAS